MSNRTSPSRSFNTVKHSNRDARRKRTQRAGMVLLAMFCVVVLILISLLTLLVWSIADRASGGRDLPPLEDNPGSNQTQNSSIVYTALTKVTSDIHTGELVVVNAEHAYVFPSSSSHLINIYDNRTKVGGSNPYQINRTFAIYMERTAFAKMEEMMIKHYELSDADGSVLIKYAYRSHKDQEDLGSSIAPGFSDHHTGLSIALHDGKEAGNPPLDAFHWIYDNCQQYGFIIRYPDNKTDITGVDDYGHCLRYVGVAHATYIKQNDLCLEEYVSLLKNQYTTEHLKITGADGNRYEVYYVPAGNGDVCTLSVPSNYRYTVSGDNIGGFIVTVNMSAPIE